MSTKHIHRTAVFTLHHPTRHVRAVLDHALRNYTHASTIILEHFSHYTVDELYAMATYAIGSNGEQLTSTKQLAKALFAREVPAITSVLAPLESRLRESLKAEIADNLMSYVELSLMPNQTPSYPARLQEEDREPFRLSALEELRTVADDLEEENDLKASLLKTKQAEHVPLSFCRIEAERNCGLFYNPETRTFYARLFVTPPESRYAKPITIAGRYIDIRTGTIYVRHEDRDKYEGVESFGTGKRSILVPLEMGKWHEQALRFTETAFLPQRNGNGTPAAVPVSAHLVKAGDEYQLHVAFRFPKPQRIKPQNLLGVDRGITALAAGAVTSLDGKTVIETFVSDGTELRTLQRNMEQVISTKQAKGQVMKGDRRRARVAEQHVHLCANQIVELAIKHQAQVVMEDLSNFTAPIRRPKGQVRSKFNKMLSRKQYQHIQDAVNAKLALVGLPPVRLVGASFTSLTCSQCGCISKESRSSEDRTQFTCVQCGQSIHADIQGGISIARKLLWLQVRGEEKQRELPESERTTWATFAKSFA